MKVVQFIRKLEGNGKAYVTPSGVYFSTDRFVDSHRFKMAPSFDANTEGTLKRRYRHGASSPWDHYDTTRANRRRRNER